MPSITSFESVSNTTVQQHHDVRVPEAYIATLVLSMSIESLPGNQGTEHVCHYRPHWYQSTKELLLFM